MKSATYDSPLHLEREFDNIKSDEGQQVVYDVAEDIREIASFAELKTLPGLFESAHLDSSRTSVVWNDRIDLPSDTIREYGGVI